MANELATVGNNPIEINKIFGFENEKMKPVIPLLKINGEDEEPGVAPKGTFTINDGESILYAPEVTIRSFLKAYQYRVYSATDKSKNDASTIEHSFKGEFRSMSGRLACGKMPKKKYLALGNSVSSTQKSLQESVKCKLLVFGLVSGKFTDLDTKKEVDLVDALFMWTVSQSAFMTMDQTINGIMQERRAVPLTYIKLKLKKEKSGAVTYFVPVPEVLTTSAILDVTKDSEHLLKIKGYITDTNEFINNKYNEAIKGKQENANFAEVGTVIDQDMNDNVNDL